MCRLLMSMNMREAAENQQMCPPPTSTSTSSSSSSSLCCFRNYLLCFSVLVLFLVLAAFSSPIFSSILLISFTVLILSTVLLFKLTKRKPGFDENQVKDEQKSWPEVEELFREPEPIQKVTQIHDYLIPKSSDFSSETESGDISFSSEDSDADWSFRNDMGQFPAMFSDDSISDDDSLIEIELPGGHYIGSREEPNFEFEFEIPKFDHYKIGTKEEPIFEFEMPNFNNFKIGAKVEPKFKQYFKTKLPELFQESIFGKEDLMELLADINEMNEEDNLIEIDISMGSIKCSRLEIEA